MSKRLTGAARAREERATGVLHNLPKLSGKRPSAAADRWGFVRNNLETIYTEDYGDVLKNDTTAKALKHLFGLIDTDGGGTISVMEFANSLRLIGKKLGERFAYPKPMQLFAQLDLDKSGDIDADELIDGIVRLNDGKLLQIAKAVYAVTSNEALIETEKMEKSSNVSQKEIASLRKEIVRLESELLSLRRENKRLKSSLDERTESALSREYLEKQKADLQQQLTNTKRASMESDSTLRRQLNGEKEQRQEYELEAMRASESEKRLLKQVSSFEAKLAEARQHASKLESEVAETKNVHASLISTRAQLQFCRKQQNALAQANEQLEQTVQQLQRHLHESSQQTQRMLAEQADKYEWMAIEKDQAFDFLHEELLHAKEQLQIVTQGGDVMFDGGKRVHKDRILELNKKLIAKLGRLQLQADATEAWAENENEF